MHAWMKIFWLQSIALYCAWVAAYAAHFLNLPLPWLLGPLLMAMVWQSFQIEQAYLVQWRQAGQWLIGTALGAYFSLDMLAILYDYAFLILFGVVWALLLGLLIALLQYRWAGLNWATAWFASCMGGASEMVNLAERTNARTDQVAASHSLRLMVLVFCVPLILQQLYKVDVYALATQSNIETQSFDLLILLTVSLLGAYVAQYFKLLNAWVLGPLIVVAILNMCQLPLASLPTGWSHLGQLLIGWSLGRKFPFRLFQVERKFVISTIVLNLAGLALSIAIANLVAHLFSLDDQTLILGFSPGGIAEMSLMAKALHLIVPVVIAFQMTRLIVVLMTSFYLYHMTQRYLLPRIVTKRAE